MPFLILLICFYSFLYLLFFPLLLFFLCCSFDFSFFFSFHLFFFIHKWIQQIYTYFFFLWSLSFMRFLSFFSFYFFFILFSSSFFASLIITHNHIFFSLFLPLLLYSLIIYSFFNSPSPCLFIFFLYQLSHLSSFLSNLCCCSNCSGRVDNWTNSPIIAAEENWLLNNCKD